MAENVDHSKDNEIQAENHRKELKAVGPKDLHHEGFPKEYDGTHESVAALYSPPTVFFTHEAPEPIMQTYADADKSAYDIARDSAKSRDEVVIPEITE